MKLLRLLLVVVLITTTQPGCGGQGSAPAGNPASNEPSRAAKRLRMGMMPKLIGINYFNACQKGAEEAAKELNIELTYDGPPTDKAELQAQMIDEWIALGYDVIAVAPNDPEVIAPALKRAKDAGIITLTWDADANPEASGRVTFVNQAPVEAIGNTLVDLMAGAIGGKGKTVIVTGSATSPNQNAWMAVMETRLTTKYPKIQLLETLVPEENQNRARQMTLDILNAHPDLAGVWGITSVSLPGVAEAVKQAGKSGKVYVTGLSLPSTIRPYVKDGTVPKFVLWNPADLGYLTVHVARRLAEHSLTSNDKFFGRLKGVDVKVGEVVLGPPLVFDKNNVDEYDF
ncbi:MAG TPA: substrate-binding domain-containing protein [Isosphaeraceae bacterium]|nr:substrate-binding domain-containing protein [Isosphaeraceae bacterium]